MLRRIVLSSAIVLLVSAGAFADIIQLQDYIVGALNGIELTQGHQEGQSSHTICINNDQVANKICGAWATQSQAALLNQVGSAQGDCAAVLVGQIFGAWGSQTQAVGDCVGPMYEDQVFDLVGTQLITKSQGAGGGSAHHMFVGNQSQAGANPMGSMSESSSIGAFQTSMLNGSPGATGAVTASMHVGTAQLQQVD